MRDFLDTLMERYIEEKANLQLQPALAAINDSPNPPVMAAEFIATIQERIDNPDKTYSSQIKIEIPLDVGWSDETYKAFADSSDKQLMESILHHTTNSQSNEEKVSSAELSETATETINQYIENQLKEKKYKLYGMKRHCSEETEITDKILEKAINRHNNICKVLASLAPEFSTPDDNKTTVFAAYLNSVIDSWTVEDDKQEHADVSVDNIEKSSSKVASERARESSDNPQRTEDKLGVMDDSIENAPETHSASANEATLETYLPRSILKELATESSTTAEEWRTSGRLNKLETDKTGIADKADETSQYAKGEQHSAESLAQQTTPPVKEKPAPNKRPKGLTLKGSTKPQVTTNTETLKDRPALKEKPELPPKPDKSILNSSVKTQETQKTETQKVKPALKPKPKFLKQTDESTAQNAVKTQETTQPLIQKAKPELKPKPVLSKQQNESTRQSTVKTQTTKNSETQRAKPATKPKPLSHKKPDESIQQSTEKLQETKKPETRRAKPPLPKKPAKLTQTQYQKPVTPTAPLKEKQVESDVQALTGKDDRTQKPGTVQHDKNSQNTTTTVTADSIVAKITGQIEGEEYKLEAEVMSDVLKLAGQPDQLRKLLEQLDQAVSAGIDIKVIRGNEQFFRDQLVSLIDNQKPNALDSVHRTGIQVKH